MGHGELVMENVLTVKKSVPLDRTKPLVKDFFDRDAEIVNYLKIRLPEYKGMKINALYSSKNGLQHKFRVNWHGEEKIESLFVEVITTKEGMVVSHAIR